MINYPGNAAGFNRAAAFSVDEPQDGIDPLNVATVNTAFELLTDGVEHVRQYAGFLPDNEIVGGEWSFTGAAGDSSPALSLSGGATTFKLQLRFDANGFESGVYQDPTGNVRIVTNAVWDDVGLKWHQDNAAAASFMS